MTGPQHHWVVAGSREGRAALAATLTPLPALTEPLDAHRRLRGPYTAAGELLRAVVPAALAAAPDLPGRYDIEILAMAPELSDRMPMRRETLTSAATVRERTRFYPADRITQLAHGITEFLRNYLTSYGRPCSITVDNVEHADATDAELLAVLLRRIDPGLLTLVVCTGAEQVAEPLATALGRYAVRHDVPATVESERPAPDPVTAPVAGPDRERLATGYVGTECLADDPAGRAAYLALDPAERARLHDRRAAELLERQELSLRLGAIPYHLERGSDPHGAGVDALKFAIDHCSLMGFYAATVDLTRRLRPLVDWSRSKLAHLATARLALALIMVGQPDDVESLYHEARLYTTEPEMHMTAAYSTAMLYTRHHRPDRIDHLAAKAWINQAIAFATTFADPAERAFHTVFMQNGLALVEAHLGNYAEALRLVEEGSARLAAELAPDEHLLHRSVLIHNGGQVRAAAGQLEEAVADYSQAIAQDPNYAPYHFDRGSVLHRLGRDAEAIAEFEEAMRLSPPLPEAYYNRGDIRAEQGDLDGALADFGYALELNPAFLNAYINRAGILADLGEDEAARRDVLAGLALEPANPYLLSILGQLEAAAGNAPAAAEAFGAAVAADPGLQAGWAGRASVAFEQGDLDAALSDLQRALEIGDSAVLRFNRAAAFMAAGRWPEALADLNRAIELDPEDPDTIASRQRCLQEVGGA
ncbi:tetratricopeptide repeat protein [Jatrophihabitans sp.]|uniref:tetratricopeptide repeat protein n=1 Tax=Jatrophihabitans sp. TaxID=1932789 RepID=UPI002CFBFD8C|nr:tetratricopeptide repeat protein [Jatrophihabitans sp.]